MDVYYNPEFLKIYGKNFNKEVDYITVNTSDLKFKLPVVIDGSQLSCPYGYGDIELYINTYAKYRGLNKIFLRSHLFNGNHKMYGYKFHQDCVYINVNRPWEEIYNDIHAYKRKNYRRATRRGVIFRKSDDIDTFKELYDNRMKEVNADKFYFFPIEYYRDLVANNFAEIYEVLTPEGEVVVSSMLLFDNRKHNHFIVYDYLRGSKGGNKNLYANDFCLVNLIKEAHRRSFSFYILGGGKAPGDELFWYKRHFSSTTKPFYIYNKEVM